MIVIIYTVDTVKIRDVGVYGNKKRARAVYIYVRTYIHHIRVYTSVFIYDHITLHNYFTLLIHRPGNRCDLLRLDKVEFRSTFGGAWSRTIENYALNTHRTHHCRNIIENVRLVTIQ